MAIHLEKIINYDTEDSRTKEKCLCFEVCALCLSSTMESSKLYMWQIWWNVDDIQRPVVLGFAISALSDQLHLATIFQSYWHTIQFLCHSCMFWKKATSGLYYLFRNRRCIHGSCRERDDMEHLNSYEQGLEKRCHLVHIIGTFLLNLEMTCISIPMRRDQKRDVIWFISQELFY